MADVVIRVGEIENLTVSVGVLDDTTINIGDKEIIWHELTPYEGEYEVTPTQGTQTLPTENKRMTANVVVNPIPSNYGLITWDGSILTVS